MLTEKLECMPAYQFCRKVYCEINQLRGAIQGELRATRDFFVKSCRHLEDFGSKYTLKDLKNEFPSRYNKIVENLKEVEKYRRN